MASLPPRSTADDDGRLPWLDHPATDASAKVGTTHPTNGQGLRWTAAILVVALVAAGAFLLGRGSDVPAWPVTKPPLSTTRLAPARPARPYPPLPQTPPALVRQTAPALARVEAQTARARPAAPELHLRPEQVRAVRGIAREARIAVHRNAVPRAPVRKAYAPRIGAPGRVVQLGAYRSVAEAEDAAQRFRYKYRGLLATLPKAVLPFRPKNSRRFFYRVQFVTPSQAYSEVTCQRLRLAAKTCIVVY